MKNNTFAIRFDAGKKVWLVPTACACLFFAGPVTAAESGVDSAAGCAQIESDAERLACYDRMAADKRQSPDTASADAPSRDSRSSEAHAEPQAGTDQETDEKDEDGIDLTVVNCEQGADGRYFFTMSNGEIWKQVNSDRLYFRSCNWDVEIIKDWFGYKMQRDGEKRRIRVKRVR